MTSRQENDRKIRNNTKKFKESIFGDMNEIEEIIVTYVKDCVKTQGELSYMIAVEIIGRKNINLIFPVERDNIKATLKHIEAKKENINSVTITNSAFMMKNSKENDTNIALKTYELGSFEKMWKSGDNRIIHIVSISIYLRDGDKFQQKNIIFEINKNNELVNKEIFAEDCENKGYLHLNI